MEPARPDTCLRSPASLLSTTFTNTIEPNGIRRTLITEADGAELGAWFVVTEAVEADGKYIATELFVVQNEIDAITGDVISGLLRRLSN